MTLPLGKRAGFWISAAVVVHTLWTSAAPSMVYPLYAAQWDLTPTVTTAIFAIYPIVVVAVLIAFGSLSDHVGHRAAMLAGLAASAAGALLFALAGNLPMLFLGRTLMGVGVGLSAGPSAAALAAFAGPERIRSAGAVTASAQALGMAAALLVGGALIQYAPWPTRLGFGLLFGVIVVLFAAVWLLPPTATPAPRAGGGRSCRWCRSPCAAASRQRRRR